MKKLLSLVLLIGAFIGADYSADAACIKHNFVSTKPESADSTVVSTNEWNECHVIESGTAIARPKITTSIDDANGAKAIEIDATASAVNNLAVVPGASGNSPQLAARGQGTDLDVKIVPKNSGKVTLGNCDSNCLVHTVSVSGTKTITWQDASGTIVLRTTTDTLTNKTLTNPALTKQTLTDQATIAWDMSAGNIAVVTLGANRIMGAPTNLPAAGSVALKIIQDGTGTRTITSWNGIFKWPAGTAPTLTTTAAHYDVITCVIFDGTNLLCNSVLDLR